MPFAAALPIIAGLLSAGSSHLANRANAKQAKNQQDFQERMSSTAAQRSVGDYRAAGLNPALAYDRSASSPGGSSTTLGEPIASGINSAMSARAAMQSVAIAKAQSDADLRLKEAQTRATLGSEELNRTNAAKAWQETLNLRQQNEFTAVNQPWDARTRAAEALLRELMIPGAKNSAGFEELIGRGRPGLASARTAAEIIKMLNPRNFRR